jgi:hypothetical protein
MIERPKRRRAGAPSPRLVDSTGAFDGSYILNTGDVGLLKSLEKLSASDASRSTNDGATVAAHVQHVRYGLADEPLATEGGNPFADTTWDAAWKTPRWMHSCGRSGRIAGKARRWLTLQTPREVSYRWHGREHRSSGVSPRRHPIDKNTRGQRRRRTRFRSASSRARGATSEQTAGRSDHVRPMAPVRLAARRRLVRPWRARAIPSPSPRRIPTRSTSRGDLPSAPRHIRAIAQLSMRDELAIPQ